MYWGGKEEEWMHRGDVWATVIKIGLPLKSLCFLSDLIPVVGQWASCKPNIDYGTALQN